MQIFIIGEKHSLARIVQLMFYRKILKSKGLPIGQQSIPTEFYQRDIFSKKGCRPFIIKTILFSAFKKQNGIVWKKKRKETGKMIME